MKIGAGRITIIFFGNEIFSCCFYFLPSWWCSTAGFFFFLFLNPPVLICTHRPLGDNAGSQFSGFLIYSHKNSHQQFNSLAAFSTHTHTSMVVTKKRKLMMTSNPLKYGWRNKEHRVSYQRCQQPKRSITIRMQIANRYLRSTCAWFKQFNIYFDTWLQEGISGYDIRITYRRVTIIFESRACYWSS